jgi:hypothetical protein
MAAASFLTGVTSFAGEHIAQEIEGKPNMGARIRSGLFGAMPLLKDSGGILKNAGKGIVAMVTAETAAETLDRSIKEGRFATYESLSEMKPVIPVAFLGAALGQMSGVAPYAASRAERMKMFSDVGVKHPTLDMLDPGYAELMSNVRKFNAKAVQELDDAQRPIAGAFAELFPDSVSNNQVREQFLPYLGKLDAQKSKYIAARDNAKRLNDELIDASSRSRYAPQELTELRKKAVAAELNAVNEQAAFTLEASSMFGTAKTNTEVAESVSRLVGKLRDERKKKADLLYQEAGIDKEEAMFRLGDIYKDASRAVSRRASTGDAKKILATIESMQDPKLGSDTLLTLNQVEELRGLFSEQFAGKNPQALNAAEALASSAYIAVVKSTEKTIKRISPDILAQYKAATSYYAQTSQAMNSRYVKAILNKEPLDSVFGTLAKDIAGGNVSEVIAFNKFISAVARDTPDVAKMAHKQFTEAIRNSVLASSPGAVGGTVNIKTAADLLSRFPKDVPVRNLGFGSKEFIADVARTFRQYGVNEVSQRVLDEAFTSPIFQAAILANKGASHVAKEVAAREAFTHNARMRYLKSAAGIHDDLIDIKTSQRLAKHANLDEAAQKKILDDLSGDPIMREFSGGETWGVSERASGGTKDIIHSIVNAGERGVKFLNTVRSTNPKIGEMLEARFMTEKMSEFFIPTQTKTGVTWEVNRMKVEEFFTQLQLMPKDTPQGMAKAFISPERLDRFKKVVRVFSEMNDIDKRAGIAQSTAGVELARALGMAHGVATGQNFTAQTQKAVGIGFVNRWRMLGQYKALSAMVGDNAFANAIFKVDGNVSKALEIVGPGRAYLLMKKYPELKEVAEDPSSN